MALPNQPYPPDIRVDKEVEVLLAAGHEVVLLCRGDGRLPAEERSGDFTVVRHQVHPDAPGLRKLDSSVFLATMNSPSWRDAMISLVRRHKVEALHLHDLPYAPSLLAAARTTGVPAVLDLHENYPAALAQWNRPRSSRIFFSPARAARLEKRMVHEVDRVIVVVDEARDRLVSLGADPERVRVFGNTEPLRLVPDALLPLDLTNGPRMVYVGGIAPHRGLDTVLAAMPAALEADSRARLTIVGDGESLQALKAQAVALDLDAAVTFTGRLPKDDAMDQVRNANIALVPHRRSPHTDSTIPHKLFQYMALGRPVIVSDCAPLARVVSGTGSGLVFRAGDAADLASRIAEAANPEAAAEMASAGRAAVLEHWNLEAEAPNLVGLYAKLAREVG